MCARFISENPLRDPCLGVQRTWQPFAQDPCAGSLCRSQARDPCLRILCNIPACGPSAEHLRKATCLFRFVPSVGLIRFQNPCPNLYFHWAVARLPFPLKQTKTLRLRPISLLASAVAPAARSRSTTEPWPFSAALCSDVQPQESTGGREWKHVRLKSSVEEKKCSMIKACASEITRKDL